MFVLCFCGISLSTNFAITGLTSLLFNKTVNGFNGIIEKKRLYLLPLNVLNYIAYFIRNYYLKTELPVLFTLYIYIDIDSEEHNNVSITL